ncbi:chondroitinase-B domain-containing protein [Algibacter mikhailovii]|uniref:chondroitinase-B domain-containing protein n=1 Tax=Algibacter mikhailovii TaxID=425498 RepID=UPI002493F0F2|nr:chondroitinase-B domain-containing protein [Algibacter mikhailovii]
MKLKITKSKLTLFAGRRLKMYLVALFFIGHYNAISQDKIYNIDDPEDLRNVEYQPGDLIILKDGVYDTDERMIFLGSGTAEKPVVFRSETPGGVIFTGGPRLTIGGESENGVKTSTGEYLVVDGFHWKGGYGASNFIEFRNGTDFAHHSTIQNCVIDGLAAEPSELEEDLADEQITKHRWVVLFGTYNSVINCSFMNKTTAGAIILGEYSYNAFPDGDDGVNNSCAVVGHSILNNYFFNYEKITELYPYTKPNGDPYSNSGDSETIRIGTSSYQMVNSNVTVSNNYFVQADGENEIITNKSKGNTFTNNTFRRCRGSLVLRHGSYATVDGNYFLGENVDGTGGIRITDSEHTITNNYIQDCITVLDNAKWNNGITFIGGSADGDVPCTSDDGSSGYQESKNIKLSRNTIINTNAPLFYNEDKGSDDPTGNVTDNLIYFEDGNSNKSDVISGDSDTAYANLGTALTYTGNVYTGTVLGETVVGFSEESGITATANGEIFSFSGSAATNKGADMGAYTPTTDAMVGYGIGACFLNFEGTKIIDGDCSIEIPESLIVGTMPTQGYEASSANVSVYANVSWTASANDSWISIDTNSGSGDATVLVSVTENPGLTPREGTVTFTQAPGGDDIERVLTVTQEGAPRMNLINTGTADDPVSVFFVSKENTSKNEVATNSLDKNMTTVWTADDGAIVGGDYKGDGEYIIYDLGSNFNLDFIQFNTTNKGDAFGFQILVSTTGTEAGDFSMIVPTTGDLLLTATGTTEFNQYEVDAEARYIKLIGYGRFDGTERKSAWSAIGEIEFFGDATSLAVEDNELANQLSMYPNPVNDFLTIKSKSVSITSVTMHSLDGRQVLEQINSTPITEFSLNLESVSIGAYIVTINSSNKLSMTKMIIVSR